MEVYELNKNSTQNFLFSILFILFPSKCLYNVNSLKFMYMYTRVQKKVCAAEFTSRVIYLGEFKAVMNLFLTATMKERRSLVSLSFCCRSRTSSIGGEKSDTETKR